MFSQRYERVCEEVSDFPHMPRKPLGSLRPMVASDYGPLFWSEGFGQGRELDQAIIARSAEVKAALYGGQVFVIVPIYVTSVAFVK
jgi:hypothetical protein